jgi:hypothetical protein
MFCLTHRTMYMILLCTPSPSPQARGPPLVGCPGRLSQLLVISGGCVFHLKTGDAPLLVQWNLTDLLIRNGTWCATKGRESVFSLLWVKYQRVYASDRRCFLEWRKDITSVLFISVVKMAWDNIVVTAKTESGYYDIGLCGTTYIASNTSYKLISNQIIFIG